MVGRVVAEPKRRVEAQDVGRAPAYDGPVAGGRASVLDWEEFYREFRQPGFIPGYELQNRLGGGAFGEVYKAKKTSIGKAYAIKFLKLDDEAQREVVQRELEQVRHFAAIDHPNLVTIEDMGIVRGVPYVVMGYAGEDTLARRLRRSPLEAGAAVSFFVQTCRGVLALHDRRLVHFDLKPSNVFLKGNVARVGDYGLAKLLTEGNQTLSFGRGTPHYMSPEMLKGRADHRSDIYSLGVVLYESLVGRTPFAAEGAAMVRIEDEPPSFPDDYPPLLREVTARCLEADPEQRFASVEELLGALGQTGRQGDSIAVLPPAGTGEGPRVAEAAGLAARAGSGKGAGADSRADAAPQGAAEVARRVWEELRATRGAADQAAEDAGCGGPAAGPEVRRSGPAGQPGGQAAGQDVEQLRAKARAAARRVAVGSSSVAGAAPEQSGPAGSGPRGSEQPLSSNGDARALQPAAGAGGGAAAPEPSSSALGLARRIGPLGRWLMREGAGLAEGLVRLLLLLLFMILFGGLLALLIVALVEGEVPWK